MSSKINEFQAFMYFNMYMVRSIYFGYYTIDINKKKCDEIRKVYKITMAKKLNLGATFLRRLLYTRRTAIGVRLLQLHTIIAVATLK